MRALAPAKINLHLRVGPVRADRFHPLLTWMCTVALFDTLDIRRAGGQETVLTIEPMDVPIDGSDAAAAGITAGVADGSSHGQRAGDALGKRVAVPADGTNLVVRAASSWVTARRSRAGDNGPLDDRGYSIVLGKRIPVGAGMGGGSSDAACTLMILNRLDGGDDEDARGARVTPAELAALGARLGSDVPFFFHGPSSICKGRGEVVTPTPPPRRARWAVLFLPDIALATAHVYTRFDAMGLGRSEDVEVEPDWMGWAELPAAELMARLVNDLENPAFDVCPPLQELRDRLSRATGEAVRMSGSGSSLFSLFDSRDDASAAHERARVAWMGRIEVVELCPTFA